MEQGFDVVPESDSIVEGASSQMVLSLSELMNNTGDQATYIEQSKEIIRQHLLQLLSNRYDIARLQEGTTPLSDVSKKRKQRDENEETTQPLTTAYNKRRKVIVNGQIGDPLPLTGSIWLDFLPQEIWYIILGFFERDTFKALRLTCRDMRQLSNESSCWSQTVPFWNVEMYIFNCKRFGWSTPTNLKISKSKGLYTPDMMKILADYTPINELTYEGHCIFNENVKHFPSSLEKLSMNMSSFNHIHQDGLFNNDGLKDLPRGLKTLALKGCKNISDEGIRFLPPSLTKLDLSGCDRISVESFIHMPSSLAELDLSKCPDISTENYNLLPTTLTKLTLNGCKGFTNICLKYLPAQLKELSISKCEKVSEIHQISSKYLVSLDLSGCTQLSDSFVKSLEPLHHLKSLNVNYCSKVTNLVIPQLPSTLTQLRTYGCKGITGDCLTELSSSITRLEFEPHDILATPIAWSAYLGNLVAVQRFISFGHDVFSHCPLHYAVSKEHMNVVQHLIEVAHVNPDSVMYPQLHTKKQVYIGHTETSLCAACEGGFAGIVSYLLSKGANPNFIRSDGVSPLWLAAQAGYGVVVSILVENGANINYVYPKTGSTPLFMACETGRINIVKFLIEAGADQDIGTTGDLHGIGPLYIASQNGHIEVVEYLLSLSKKNIDNACIADGTTSLYMTVQNGHLKVLEALLKHGANPNLYTSGDTVTPLYMACQNGKYDMVKTLLSYGADTETPCQDDGTTPLWRSCQKGHKDIVELLISYGADVNKSRNYGSTPTYIASQNGHVEIVEMLLRAGGDPNTPRTTGFTPLFIASQNGHKEVVSKLLEYGANVNQCRNNEGTPLTISSFTGYFEIVKLLLEKGANVNLRDEDGNTALENSRFGGYSNIATLLEQYHAI